MSALLALVQGLLTQNLRADLRFWIMLLMVQGIHPEIIFALIPYVSIRRQQHEAIMMAWTLLREFSFLLPGVKGVKPQTFQQQLKLYMRFPLDRVSLIFRNFQDSVLRRMLTQCGFTGPLPSFEIVKRIGFNIAVVQTVHQIKYQIGSLFLIPNYRLVLMKTALQMQEMIEHVRLFSPDIVSFLQQNKNAVNNIILVWGNQVVVQRGSNSLENNKMKDLFAFLILAVIVPEFDRSLEQLIANCGDRNVPFLNIQEHSKFLKDNCQSIAPMISGHFLDIGQVLYCFSSMLTFLHRSFQVRYALRPWSMAFGKIVLFGHPEFEEVKIEQESCVPIFDVFSTFWYVFFRNFERSFSQSFLPFGNILWSENITRLCTTDIANLISHVVPTVAYNMGCIDDHAYLQREYDSKSKDISPACYASIFFPAFKRYIIIYFIRDFWEIHQNSVKPMNDLEFLRWLSSIPEYASYLKSSLDLIDALMHGTALPSITDGSSCDHSWLCPTNSAPSWSSSDEFDYQKHFIGLMGRKLEIEDFARIAPK